MAIDSRKVAVATAGFCTFLNLYSPQALLPSRLRMSSLAESHLTRRSSQPLTGESPTFNFMKPFSMFATLALASGGSAPSR